jgi:hypothetical protein
MFLEKLDFIFKPIRAVYNRFLGAKNTVGNVQLEGKRAKAYAQRGKGYAQQAGALNDKVNAAAGVQPQGANMQEPGQPGAPGAPGAPLPPGVPNPNPPLREKGFLFKKKFCTQCDQQLDRSWDACPYCAQIAQQVVAAPAKAQAMKTQAFVLDSQGGPGTMQLLGWIVPLQGPQKGELCTLQAVTTVGTDPKCTLVLNDKFMSSKHAEIKAENGIWVLKDSGSTNGTYVNNKRIDRHELVDNDFVKFGSFLLKFKSL